MEKTKGDSFKTLFYFLLYGPVKKENSLRAYSKILGVTVVDYTDHGLCVTASC